jgi:hypothetical protein
MRFCLRKGQKQNGLEIKKRHSLKGCGVFYFFKLVAKFISASGR